MPRTYSDRAIVLRAWSVGETDRFCILLTKENGRIAVRVPGARRLLSRRGRGLLPLHVVQVSWTEKGTFFTVTDASCTEANPAAWQNIGALTAAEKAVELVLSLTEDHAPVPELFALTEEFLSHCSDASEGLLALFTIKILALSGNFPSARHSAVSGQRFGSDDTIVWSSRLEGFSTETEEPYGLRIDADTHRLLTTLDHSALHDVDRLPPETIDILLRIASRYSPIQLGFSSSTVAPPRSRSISAAVTPT